MGHLTRKYNAGLSFGLENERGFTPSRAVREGALPNSRHRSTPLYLESPQGLKPASLLALGGTAEAVPLPFVEAVSLFAAVNRCATQKEGPLSARWVLRIQVHRSLRFAQDDRVVGARMTELLDSLFHRLRVQFLRGFASGQALGDDQAAGFDAQFGQRASEPDGAEDAGHSSQRRP